MFDLAIEGLIFADELRNGCVYVKDGIIAKISPYLAENADRILRLEKNQLLLPAAADLHVHLRDWRQSRKETVMTGTRAALAGGVTTVAEMPNTDPRLNTEENVRRRFELLSKESYVDFAVHAGVPENLSEIDGLRRAGAFAVKVFPDDMPKFDGVAHKALRLGMKMAVHAEERSMIGTPDEPSAERKCVQWLLRRLNRRLDVRFAHLSTEAAAALVDRKRRAGYRLSLEVAPHHLFVTRGLSESRIGTASAVRPPLRERKTVRNMSSLFAHSIFDFYATDHAPHTTGEKFSRSPAPGFTGVEFAYALLLTRSGIETACRTYCEKPALYLGVKKGIIQQGFEADMVIFSKRRWTINPRRFISKGKVTPFKGETMRFAVDTVIKGGKIAYAQGKFVKPLTRAIEPRLGVH